MGLPLDMEQGPSRSLVLLGAIGVVVVVAVAAADLHALAIPASLEQT